MENQFIQFTDTIDPLAHEIALPTKNGAETSFFTNGASMVDIVTPDGATTIKSNAGTITDNMVSIVDLSKLAPGDYYRLKAADKIYGEEITQNQAETKEIKKNSISLGQTQSVQIGQEMQFPAGKYKLTIKNFEAKALLANSTIAKDFQVEVRLQDGSNVLGKATYRTGPKALSFTFSVDSTCDPVVNVYYKFTAAQVGDSPINNTILTIRNGMMVSETIEEITTYSNLLRREEDDTQLSTLKYLCYESAFGLPFGDGSYISQSVPVLLGKPQYKQDDHIYTKRNGEQVVLFSNITKEYEGETDYIPMEWHEKILLALSSDEVYINGERLTKSGNYEIDHDNCTYSDCGIKLMRATFKVTTNVTQRNSNY